MAQEQFVETDHCRIAIRQSRENGPAVLFIHGNSSTKDVFAKQFESPELADYRLVAFDLPGHGQSEDARDPERSYSFGGYADVARQVVEKLELRAPAVFGWSLGGHIGLEMVGLGMPVAKLMISGTPPVRAEPESLMAGFNIDPDAENLTGKRDFTDEDALVYATHTSGVNGSLDPHLLAMCRRTDGRARELMLGSVAQGKALDEREIVETTNVPLAIVNGAEDVFIRPEYFGTLNYSSLWKHGVVHLDGAAHAPFLQQPETFNRLLKEFIGDAPGAP